MGKIFRHSFFSVLALACLPSCIGRNVHTPPVPPVPPDIVASQIEVIEQSIPKTAIRARIRIETYTVALEGRSGMQINTFDAATIEQIEKDLRRFEIEFEKLNLCIEIQSVEYIDPIQNAIVTEHDLRSYEHITRATDPNDLYIYYIMSHGCMPRIAGYSVFPWNKGNSIFILGRIANEYTLTHEMGHYLGLMHTFDIFGDKVDDTVDFGFEVKRDDYFSSHLGDPAFDPNATNIMTYTPAFEQSFTDGQLERARFYLENYRARQTGELRADYDLNLLLRTADTDRFNRINEIIRSLNPDVYIPSRQITVEP